MVEAAVRAITISNIEGPWNSEPRLQTMELGPVTAASCGCTTLMVVGVLGVLLPSGVSWPLAAADSLGLERVLKALLFPN